MFPQKTSPALPRLSYKPRRAGEYFSNNRYSDSFPVSYNDLEAEIKTQRFLLSQVVRKHGYSTNVLFFFISIMTFNNWIKQNIYFGKLVHYVEAFKVSDIRALIHIIMESAVVTRLFNTDEMFFQFYPKETNLITPTNLIIGDRFAAIFVHSLTFI